MQHTSIWDGPVSSHGGHQEHQMNSLSPGIADQLFVAQLHALHLGTQQSGAARPRPPSPASSSHGGSIGSPHQHLDPVLLSSDLMARLHLSAACPSAIGLTAHLASPALAGLPAAAAATTAPAAAHHPCQSLYLQPPLAQQPPQQQQQQKQQQLLQPSQQQQQQQRGSGGALGRRRSGGGAGGRRNEEKVRRTIYVSDISEGISEAQLAGFFGDCGQLVDVRVCGDPNSSMRFAFIEFMSEDAAQQAQGKSGAMLGDFPIRVSPSKTAIVPVNNTYLPRSSEEQQLVARTVFVGNVDRVVEREQLREFFDNLCGPVSKIRLLGDSQHNAKIAFVEFVSPVSAQAALKLSGALLGTLPLRVSPSKTPVRVESRRGSEARTTPIAHTLGIGPAGVPAVAPPNMAAVIPGGTAPQQSLAHAQLSPALLLAVAGLQLYPGAYPV